MGKKKKNQKQKEEIANRAHAREDRDAFKREGQGIPGRESQILTFLNSNVTK